MIKDTEQMKDWGDEFDQIRERIATAQTALRNLGRWLSDHLVPEDVLPRPMLPPAVSGALSELDEGLRTILAISGDLKWRLCSNPLQSFLTGQRLSREEFYLLAAQAILKVPSQARVDEAFQEFAHYLYEDDQRRGYINPSEHPDPPPVLEEDGSQTQRVHFKIGIVPEEVRKSCLRPDQKDFFERFRPKLFFRFRND